MTGDKPVDDLYMLIAAATFMMVAWILESVWRNEKHKILWVVIFPPAIFFYIIKYWEETRAKWFFFGLLMFITLILGAFANHNFIARIMLLLGKISIWPYYAYQFIYPKLIELNLK